MSQTVKFRHVILTGAPGIGKTTLVRRVCDALTNDGHRVSGFYTDEVRQNGRRIGFDVTTLSGTRCPLARIQGQSNHARGYQVGQYVVNLETFEQAAIDSLRTEDKKGTIVVIDEIGKMELFSAAFKDAVTKLFSDPNVTILATIPIAKGRPIAFVETIRSRHDIQLFEVTRENRSELVNEIVPTLKKCLKSCDDPNE